MRRSLLLKDEVVHARMAPLHKARLAHLKKLRHKRFCEEAKTIDITRREPPNRSWIHFTAIFRHARLQILECNGERKDIAGLLYNEDHMYSIYDILRTIESSAPIPTFHEERLSKEADKEGFVRLCYNIGKVLESVYIFIARAGLSLEKLTEDRLLHIVDSL